MSTVAILATLTLDLGRQPQARAAETSSHVYEAIHIHLEGVRYLVPTTMPRNTRDWMTIGPPSATAQQTSSSSTSTYLPYSAVSRPLRSWP